MYSVYAYGTMIQPGPRVDAYLAAMRAAIRPGSTVMDLGCGTGFFAVHACRMGASKVYALEPDGAIGVAREVAAASGCAERIEFIQESSLAVSASWQADVIVSDLRGVLPLFRKHISSIVDARARFLAPGGKLICERDTVWVAPVGAPELYRPYAEPWVSRDGVDLSAGRRIAVNSWRKAKVVPENLLCDPARWLNLDYGTVTAADAAGSLEWRPSRPGTCHGFAAWFDAQAGGGAGFSNAPGKLELIYGQAFFPLAEPVSLQPGDVLRVDLGARLIGEDYVWTWNSEARASDGKVKARHEQSSFHGATPDRNELRRRDLAFRPELSGEGRLAARVLELMAGDASVDEIARDLQRSHPERFPELRDARQFVGDLCVKYAR